MLDRYENDRRQARLIMIGLAIMAVISVFLLVGSVLKVWGQGGP
jgi:hypothetical protein